MRHRIIVIGAGMGGLTAAIYLARQGYRVQVLEARGHAGGLAEGVQYEDLNFDAGPYVLLDRPGLEWAFEQLGLRIDESLRLLRIADVYEVISAGDEPPVHIHHSLDRTAEGLQQCWPGSAQQYRQFIEYTTTIYNRLKPLQTVARPGLRHLLRAGAWRHVPFLLRSLHTVLKRTGLPRTVQQALGVWTHVAGQELREAPSPLALVPTVIHSRGAWYPAGGIGHIASTLCQAAAAAGAELHYETPVRTIRCNGGQVSGVETASGDFLPADAVLANAAALKTYLQLLDATSCGQLARPVQRRLERLPLQSPGVCAYLAVKRPPAAPYLRFFLPGDGQLCRLLVQPGVLNAEAGQSGWWPARLIAPMRYGDAMGGGIQGQRDFLAQVLEERWWRELVGQTRVLATRIPADWSAEYGLYRESMNPVMTAQFMRRGRLAHRSPYVPGLYLAGSATHPGQWVSFCAISGILAAERIVEDLPCC